MKTWLVPAALVLAAASSTAQDIEPRGYPQQLDQVRLAALGGDYQAQRNLAYALATGDMGLKGKTYPAAACAWYMTVPFTNRAKMHTGDTSNVWVYCKKLDPAAYDAALTYSAQLVERISKTR